MLFGFSSILCLLIVLCVSSRVWMMMFALRIFPSAIISGSSPWSLVLIIRSVYSFAFLFRFGFSGSCSCVWNCSKCSATYVVACARMVSHCSVVPSESRVAKARKMQCPFLGIVCIVRVLGSSSLARLSCLSVFSCSLAADMIDSVTWSVAGLFLGWSVCVSLFVGWFCLFRLFGGGWLGSCDGG